MTRLTKTEDTTTGTDTWITTVGVSNEEYLVVASVGEYGTSGFSDA